MELLDLLIKVRLLLLLFCLCEGDWFAGCRFLSFSPLHPGSCLIPLASPTSHLFPPGVYHRQAWGKDEGDPAVSAYMRDYDAYMAHFNRLSYLVASEVCIRVATQERVDLIRLFVGVGRELIAVRRVCFPVCVAVCVCVCVCE